jgi:hypothetical protein
VVVDILPAGTKSAVGPTQTGSGIFPTTLPTYRPQPKLGREYSRRPSRHTARSPKCVGNIPDNPPDMPLSNHNVVGTMQKVSERIKHTNSILFLPYSTHTHKELCHFTIGALSGACLWSSLSGDVLSEGYRLPVGGLFVDLFVSGTAGDRPSVHTQDEQRKQTNKHNQNLPDEYLIPNISPNILGLFYSRPRNYHNHLPTTT